VRAVMWELQGGACAGRGAFLIKWDRPYRIKEPKWF